MTELLQETRFGVASESSQFPLVSSPQYLSTPDLAPADIDNSDSHFRDATKSAGSLRYSLQLLCVGLPLAFSDALAISFSWMIGILATAVVGMPPVPYLTLPLFAAAAFSICGWANGVYPGVGLHPVLELQRLFRASTAASAMMCGTLVLFVGGGNSLLLTLLIAFPMQLVLLPLLRAGTKTLMRFGRIGIPFFFVGERDIVLQAYRDMSRFGSSLLIPAGRFVPMRSLQSTTGEIHVADAQLELEFERDVPYLGTPEESPAMARELGVYSLCVVGSEKALARLQAAAIIQEFPEVFCIHAHPYRATATATVVHCGLASGVRLEAPLLSPTARLVKRLMDILIASVALTALLPLFMLLAVMVKLTSRGSIFFSHRRIGRGGKEFKAWKFRTMVNNAQELLIDYLLEHPQLRAEWERDHKLKHDPRVTWIGKFLRKTSLDELPQLWSVLIGEMSLVGPRPIIQSEIAKYGTTFADYLRVPPGITGLWQVSGRNNTTYSERLALDEYYVSNWSLWLDIYILMRTVKTVVFCEGAY